MPVPLGRRILKEALMHDTRFAFAKAFKRELCVATVGEQSGDIMIRFN